MVTTTRVAHLTVGSRLRQHRHLPRAGRPQKRQPTSVSPRRSWRDTNSRFSVCASAIRPWPLVRWRRRCRRPQPLHGHLSSDQARRQKSFTGVPLAVHRRALPLALVEDLLPPALEATAWAEDGVVMGVRHRGPPPGVCSSTPSDRIGARPPARFPANFRDLTREAARTLGSCRHRGSTTDSACHPVRGGQVGLPLDDHRPSVRGTHRRHLRGVFFASAPNAFWLDRTSCLEDRIPVSPSWVTPEGPLTRVPHLRGRLEVVTVHAAESLRVERCTRHLRVPGPPPGRARSRHRSSRFDFTSATSATSATS